MKKSTHDLVRIPVLAALVCFLAVAVSHRGWASGPSTESESSSSRLAGVGTGAGATASGAAGSSAGVPTMSAVASPSQQSPSPSLSLSTRAFKPGAMIPKQFACEGLDASPDLDWSNAPRETRSFALIVEDPDAPGGTWVHWVVYDLPPGTHHLPEGVPKRSDIEAGGRQGDNDFGKPGYNGPCPPPGRPHRYLFRLYALDTLLNLKGRVTKAILEQAIEGHVLAQAELMGRYQR